MEKTAIKYPPKPKNSILTSAHFLHILLINGRSSNWNLLYKTKQLVYGQYEKYNYIWKGNSMKILPVRNYFLWVALAVVVAIAIYKIGFHRPVPGFNEEAVRKIMAK